MLPIQEEIHISGGETGFRIMLKHSVFFFCGGVGIISLYAR